MRHTHSANSVQEGTYTWAGLQVSGMMNVLSWEILAGSWTGCLVVAVSSVACHAYYGERQFYPAMVEASSSGLLSVTLCSLLGISCVITAKAALNAVGWRNMDIAFVATNCFFQLTESLFGIALCMFWNPKLHNSEEMLFLVVFVQLIWKTLHVAGDIQTTRLEATHNVPFSSVLSPLGLLMIDALGVLLFKKASVKMQSPARLIVLYDCCILSLVSALQFIRRLFNYLHVSQLYRWEGSSRVPTIKLCRYLVLLLTHGSFFLFCTLRLRVPVVSGLRSIAMAVCNRSTWCPLLSVAKHVQLEAATQELDRRSMRISLIGCVDRWIPYATQAEMETAFDTVCPQRRRRCRGRPFSPTTDLRYLF